MRIVLLSEFRIRLEGSEQPLTIEAASSDADFSPFHMLASGLGACVYSLLYGWALQAKLSPDDLAIEVTWRFADEPRRVARYDLTLEWPSLPEERRAAAVRLVDHCPVHATLENPTELVTVMRK